MEVEAQVMEGTSARKASLLDAKASVQIIHASMFSD
jgi:hypothetical protein